MTFLAEGIAHVGLLRGAWQVFSDPQHILAEAGWELITFALFAPRIWRWLHRRFDREHGIDHDGTEDSGDAISR